MKLAIIGLERSGKTTVFKALTGSSKEIGTFGKIEAAIAMIKVPDERIDFLFNLYKPKKAVHADIEFIDIPGNINDSSDPKTVATAREADALVYTLRAFKNDNVPHPLGDVNPARDFAGIETGLLLSDMTVAEKRIKDLEISLKRHSDKTEMEKVELAALKKIMEKLELEEPASEAALSESEKKSIRSFQFLTLKPYIALLNVSEDGTNSEETKKTVSAIPNCAAMCAEIEMEIRALDEKDRADFMKELGIKELSLDFLVKKAYETLNLISFFTINENEVRAWAIKRDATALEAAGKIHSDLERGFIRAEVFSYDDLRKYGSEKAIKDAGRFRLEAKDYIVRDGDILRIKFSV